MKKLKSDLILLKNDNHEQINLILTHIHDCFIYSVFQWVSLSLPLGNFSALSLSAISVKPLFESLSLHPAGLSAPLAMA